MVLGSAISLNFSWLSPEDIKNLKGIKYNPIIKEFISEKYPTRSRLLEIFALTTFDDDTLVCSLVILTRLHLLFLVTLYFLFLDYGISAKIQTEISPKINAGKKYYVIFETSQDFSLALLLGVQIFHK